MEHHHLRQKLNKSDSKYKFPNKWTGRADEEVWFLKSKFNAQNTDPVNTRDLKERIQQASSE